MLKTSSRVVIAFCLAFGLGVVHNEPTMAYLDGCGCDAERIAALNEADRQLREMLEDCGTDLWCQINATNWHRARVDQIWDNYFLCVETCPGGVG
ncbi:MAG: hypothetical protein OXQ90_01795 [Gammaproteobacteria bacterium]|nr:hypothetical protein [Gammaproteobacteria bacterium]